MSTSTPVGSPRESNEQTRESPSSPTPKRPRHTASGLLSPEDISPGPLVMISVPLKEAALDSPSFRASVNHIHEQFEAMDRWMDTIIKAMGHMLTACDTLQESANIVTSRFVPDFVTRGVIDHDYTTLVMRRYAEGFRHFWALIIKQTRNKSLAIQDTISTFQKTHMRGYKEARRNFELAQQKYDTQLSKYLQINKSKEPSAIREEAFQAMDLKRSYIKASFDLSCIIAQVEGRADHVFIEAFASTWVLDSGFSLTDPTLRKIALDMHRLKSYSVTTAKSFLPLEAEMMKIRKNIEEQALQRCTLTRDVNHYSKDKSVLTQFVPDKSAVESASAEKHGWLLIKSASKSSRQPWVRRWAFVKNGMFGWLLLSPSKNFVQETDKVGVLLCNVSPEPNEDRRFCFEIRTKSTAIVLQAENMSELISWLQAFEVSKRQVLVSDSQTDVSAGVHQIYPPIAEFASTSHATVDMDFTHDKLAPVDGEGSLRADDGATVFPSSTVAETTSGLLKNTQSANLQSMINSCREEILDSIKNNLSSLGPYGCALAPSVAINAPMPTAMTVESFITNTFIGPSQVPNAVTANYWGSTNWAASGSIPSVNLTGSFMAEKSVTIPKLIPQPPDSYLPLLRSQDSQMRAIFQSMVDEDYNDRVVFCFRALLRAKNTKQDIPARLFCTPKFIYIYARAYTFVALIKRPWIDMISIERQGNTSYDTLHVLMADKTTSFGCRIFIDSGSVIQRACQFLIDNSYSDTSLTVAEIMQSIQKIIDARVKRLKESVQDGGTDDDFLMSDLENEAIDNEKDNKSAVSSLSKRFLERYLLGKSSSPSDRAVHSKDTDYGLSYFSMDRCVGSFEYHIAPKALFHVMFGKNSPVFFYDTVLLYSRKELKITPWAYSSNNKLEREASYYFHSTGSLAGSKGTKDRVSNIQRIEKRVDNKLYVVYDRRTPWVLPHGYSFYTVSRYVIQLHGKSRSTLKIFSTVEWIKSSPVAKTMVDGLIYHHLSSEANAINENIETCLKRLGDKGMTVTAIRLFGKLGAKREEKAENEEGNESAATSSIPSDFYGNRVVSAWFLIVLLSYIFSPVTLIFRLLAPAFKWMVRELSINKFLIMALMVSLTANLYMTGQNISVMVSDWRAERGMMALNLLPCDSATMKRAIYLSDIEDMIKSGEDFTSHPDSSCYKKFQSFSGFNELEDDTFIAGLDHVLAFDEAVDERSIKMRRKVQEIRLDTSIERNDLLVKLRLLNYFEKESLHDEYRNWLASEIIMCERVAEAGSAVLSDETADKIREYCMSCANEWNTSYSTVSL